jgi:hypothetical protein
MAIRRGMDNFRDSLTSATRTVGNFVSALSAPAQSPTRFIEGLGKSIEGGSAAIMKLGPLFQGVAPIVYMFGGAVGAATSALGQFMHALDQSAAHYAQYNPQLALAEAMADVRQTLGDLRRAQRAGPALAQYVTARAELQQKIEDMKVRFMTRLVPLAINGMAILEKALPYIEAIMEAITAVLEVLSGTIGGDVSNIKKKLEEAQQKADLEKYDLTHIFSQGFLLPGETLGRTGAPGVRTPEGT